MPEAHVYMAAGRTDEEKKGMMLDITRALVDTLAGPPEVCRPDHQGALDGEDGRRGRPSRNDPAAGLDPA
jgi:hypothetical protein